MAIGGVDRPGGAQCSCARNPLPVEMLRDCGHVDACGMGVRRNIVPLIRDYTGSEAVFEASDDFLRTTLSAKLTEQATR